MISSEDVAEISMKVEAELRAPTATVQLMHVHVIGSTDKTLREDDVYRIDLCLSPRLHNARACYRERWGPNRFEPMGKMFLLPPGETLRARSDCTTQTQATILYYLRKEALLTWFEGDLEWTDHRLEAGLNVANKNIRNLMLRLGDEMRHPGFATDVLVELVAVQMAIELRDYCSTIGASPASGGLAPWRLRLVEERLREVRAAPTLPELADLCNISVRQLARSFRASRGCSIGDYVAQTRIENAKKLLAGKESIKAIAYSLGFAAPCYFSYAFRHVTGQTPSEYRQRTLRRDKYLQ